MDDGSKSYVDGRDVVNLSISEFSDRHSGKSPPPLSTGIPSLDRAIMGLLKSKMYVVGARPGMGKTAFSATLRRSVLDLGKVVVEFNLEMGLSELGDRELASSCRVDLRKVVSGKHLSHDEISRIMAAKDSIEPGLWWAYDDVFTLDGIVSRCRAAKEKALIEDKEIGLVVVDYIGLISDVTENRQQSVSRCSRAMKLMSKELKCAFLVLTQLNRSCEYREDKRPLLSDIRESGSLEQDADVVAFLYRQCMYDSSASKTEAEFIIRKQRAGPTGDVRLKFNPELVLFEEAPKEMTYEEKRYSDR
jgi:replicative DNA helicase